MAFGLLACISTTVLARVSPFGHPRVGSRVGPTFNIEHFGAVGDNATLNTKAFERAVQAIADTDGGGTIFVPDGVFITGPFNMTSHMTLFLSGGATVRAPTVDQMGGSPDFPLWPVIQPMPSYGQGRDHPGPRRTSLIHGENLVDITVTSAVDSWGLIDGNGEPWWEAHESKKEKYTRGHLIEFINCSNVEISNLRLHNSPFWTVHPVYSRHVTVRNIDVWAPKDSPNTDGVDPESSQDVLIENFRYHGGDDVIAIKSGWDCFGYDFNMPCKNIMIRNVTAIWTRAAGCAIGSEMSGGMENITVENCNFTNTGNGLNIKYSTYRGGYVKNITYRNIIMGDIGRSALTVDSGYGSMNPSCQPPHKMEVPVSSISYTNLTQAPGTRCRYLLDFKGLDTNTILDVDIDKVHLNYSTAFKSCEYVRGTYHDSPGVENCKLLQPRFK